MGALRPPELPSGAKLQLLYPAGAFMLDVERSVRRDTKSLAGRLDAERHARLQDVGHPA